MRIIGRAYNLFAKGALMAIFAWSFTTSFYAQIGGATCQGMTPLCTDVGLNFIAPTGGVNVVNSIPSNNWGCMWTGPNPSWYYIEVDLAGNIDMTLSAGQDIDFVLWGPYSSVANAVANCGNLGNAPGTDVVIDCGISPSNIESVNIPGAQVGQVYVLLIANFAGVAQNINLTQTGGTGGTDCSILAPCNVTNLSTTISACQAVTNTFNVSGTFTYTNSPAAGTCTVTVTNSAGSYTQTFNPPFTNNVPVNFNVTGVPSNGSPVTVTVSFSGSPSCTLSVSGTSPQSCGCIADAGTSSAFVNGIPTNSTNLVLCFGDELDLNSNNNFIPPGIANNPPGPPYDPGLSWLIYSCPPSLALTPSTTVDLTDDPCLLGVISDINLNELNDGSLISSFPPGTFTNNTIYFVPVTMYSMQDSYYSYVNTTLPCYDLGTVYTVQYAPEMTTSVSQNCANGTITATLNGGVPAISNSSYTVVPGSLTPNTATFVNTSALSGGTIALSGLTNNQPFSFDVDDLNGCQITISGVYDGLSSTSLSYPQQNYCVTDNDPMATVNAAGGGVFSSTAGINLNSANGLIDLSASTPGTYTITYTPPAGSCQQNAVFTLTVHGLPQVFAGNDLVVCGGEDVILTGSGANTYNWTNGVTNAVPFIPQNTSVYTVTGISSFGCVNSDDVMVTVLVSPPVFFSPSATNGCSPFTVTFTNNTQNTSNCVWGFGNGYFMNGCDSVTYTFTQPGCYDITLSTEVNGCPSSLTTTNLICVEEYPEVGFIPSSSIATELSPVIQFINTTTGADSYYWEFGDELGYSSLEDPSFDFSDLPFGNYWVTLVASTDFGCADSVTALIVVAEDVIFYVPNSFTPNDDTYNGEFKPVFTSGYNPFQYKLLIFNRWGETVFESNNALVGWDGTYGSNKEKIAQSGTYNYRIEFKNTVTDRRQAVIGHVNLLR